MSQDNIKYNILEAYRAMEDYKNYLKDLGSDMHSILIYYMSAFRSHAYPNQLGVTSYTNFNLDNTTFEAQKHHISIKTSNLYGDIQKHEFSIDNCLFVLDVEKAKKNITIHHVTLPKNLKFEHMLTLSENLKDIAINSVAPMFSLFLINSLAKIDEKTVRYFMDNFNQAPEDLFVLINGLHLPQAQKVIDYLPAHIFQGMSLENIAEKMMKNPDNSFEHCKSMAQGVLSKQGAYLLNYSHLKDLNNTLNDELTIQPAKNHKIKI